MDQLICIKDKSVVTTEATVAKEHIEVEKWLLKYIFGRQGENIKHFTENLKVQVNFLDDQIELQGKPDEIKFTKKMIIDLIQELKKHLAYEEIKINSLFHYHIIGKNGTNVNKLKQDPLTLISIPSGRDIIQIEGKTEDVAQVKKALLEMIYDMEIEVTVDLTIEQRFHHNFVGEEGRRLQDIKEKFNQVSITFPEPCLKSDKVLISGRKRDVESCYEYLQALNEEMKLNNFIVNVPIYKQNYKFFLGDGEKYIEKIRDESSVRIDFPIEGLESDVITISGLKEDVLAAKCKILALQENLDNMITEEITIPAIFHDSIIGKKAGNIDSISKNCGGVTIKFPTRGTEKDKVSIHGPKEDVLKAKHILLEITQEKQLTSYTAKVKVDPKSHKHLIAENGVNNKKVEERTGAKIVFLEEKEENSDVIHISGRKEEVEAAKKELEKIIADLENICEEKILIDPKYHRHFHGKHGEVLKQISDEFGDVSVSFPRKDSNSHEVRLKGRKEFIEMAKIKLLEIISDLDPIITTECVIPQEHHRAVLGANGSNIQTIEKDFDVTIKFPSMKQYDSNRHNIITIKGKKENCDNARLALLDLVTLSEVVKVPHDLHRFIIGKNGNKIAFLEEFYNVDIIIPPQKDHSDFITIKGTSENVDKTILALEHFKLEKQDKMRKSFKLTFEVDPQYHPKIIGRNGARVNKIREDYDVQIKIPDQKTNKSVITIAGYEKNAEAAKKAILELVPEWKSKDFYELDYPEVAVIHSKHLNNEEEENYFERDVEFEERREEDEEYPEFDDEEWENEEEHLEYDDDEEELENEEKHLEFDDEEELENLECEETPADTLIRTVVCNKTQLTTSTTVFKCSCIRIGSYKIYPEQHDSNIDVILTETSFKFVAPSLHQDRKKFIVINLRACDTVKMWIHFGKCMPVIFAYTSKQFGESVQNQLNLIKGSTVFFDPTSDDMKMNKVIFVMNNLSEEHHSFMRQIFPGPEKLKEINRKEANEILLKSTPMFLKENNEENDSVNHLSIEDKIMIRSLTEAKLNDLKNIFQARRFKKR